MLKPYKTMNYYPTIILMGRNFLKKNYEDS